MNDIERRLADLTANRRRFAKGLPFADDVPEASVAHIA